LGSGFSMLNTIQNSIQTWGMFGTFPLAQRSRWGLSHKNVFSAPSPLPSYQVAQFYLHNRGRGITRKHGVWFFHVKYYTELYPNMGYVWDIPIGSAFTLGLIPQKSFLGSLPPSILPSITILSLYLGSWHYPQTGVWFFHVKYY